MMGPGSPTEPPLVRLRQYLLISEIIQSIGHLPVLTILSVKLKSSQKDSIHLIAMAIGNIIIMVTIFDTLELAYSRCNSPAVVDMYSTAKSDG